MKNEEWNIKWKVLTLVILLSSEAFPLAAQTQEKNKEIRLNEEAVRMIQFDFSGIEKPQEELKTHPMNQPWMEFKKDLRIPRSLIDTTKVKKPTGYIRAEPYTIWTRFGEDPVYDVLVLGRPKKWTIHWELNPGAVSPEEYGQSLAPGTGMMYDRASGRVGGSLGAGAVIGGLDFIGFIYNNLTPHGRMLKHNRKHANAWKTYKNYRPTREDSLKFPTYYRLLPVYAPADSDTLTHTVQADTLPKAAAPAQTPDTDRFSKYIRQRQREDSIRRQEYFRKDKIRENSYDIEKQNRRLRERQE